ncbi:MAG: pro-sigmaK processing inhibitor BofA family protein [Candidatus Altiarchaeota archaeon]|nr:pro-sigmaK processing inhibitor BofA family protein [Candidatus Altiarchaeota archaeon]
MDDLIVLMLVALTLLAFIYLFWKVIKKVLINSVVGVVLILVINLVFGLTIDLNGYTIVAVALFGLPAVGTILLLYLGGMLV